MNQQI